jgi:hypothetical protein
MDSNYSIDSFLCSGFGVSPVPAPKHGCGGPFVGYEAIASLELRNSRVVAYRVNGGATTDYAIMIVQELPVFPGIVLIKDLHHGYHEYNATLKPGEVNGVIVSIDGKASEYRVRSFVYF